MLEKVNKSVEDEWIKNTAQWKMFKSEKNPGLGEEELVRETIEFSEYANPLNKTILAAMQEGVSYELLHECLSNVLRGHLKLNKVVNWLKAEKNVVTVKVVIAKHFGEFEDFSTARLQQILGPQFTTQFIIDLAKSTNDLIKRAQTDAKKAMKKKMRIAKTPEERKRSKRTSCMSPSCTRQCGCVFLFSTAEVLKPWHRLEKG
eukprot:g14775.t1